jgi:hypothetical protein
MHALQSQESDLVRDLGQGEATSYVEKALGLGFLLTLLAGSPPETGAC